MKDINYTNYFKLRYDEIDVNLHKRYSVDYLISKNDGEINYTMIWDNFTDLPVEKHGEQLGKFPSLDDKCRTMNLQYEDDLLYLNEIKQLQIT